MKKIQTKIKEEKGVSSVVVVITVLTFACVLTGTFAIISARAAGQIKSDMRIQEIYKNEVDRVDEIYDEQIAKSGRKIKFSDGSEETIGLEESLANFYGKQVSSTFFTSNENNVSEGTPDWNWQLFYDDSSRIYLIASNYVTTDKLPAYGNTGYTSTTNGCLIKTNGKNASYNAAFCSNTSYNDYVLASTTAYQSGASTTALTSNPLTSKYLRWVQLNSDSTKTNIKCVAFMMDRDKWSDFAGNMYTGAFAIGGPTIEMLNKSWNAYTLNNAIQLGTYSMTLDSDYTSNGYKVWDRANSAWADNGSANDLGTSTNMWAILESDKAFGYWLASPSSTTASGMRRVNYEGKIISNTVNYTGSGFRPIVAIPKGSI